MNRSLRWRLQGWYAVVLLAVVGGFATLLYAQVRAARFQEIDAALTADALYLDTNLRRLPPFDPDRRPDGPRPQDGPPFDKGDRRRDRPFDGPPPDEGPDRRPPPDRPRLDRPDRRGPPPNRERIIAELNLPP